MTADSEEKLLVDTLFGIQEEIPPAKAVYDEELPHFLFNQDDDSQALLPLINVPYYRPRILSQPRLSALIPYLNELSLFEKQWGYGLLSDTRESWCRRMKEEAAPLLNSVRDVCEREKILQPRSIFAYLYAKADGDKVHVYRSDGTTVLTTIPFERLDNGVSPADKFSSSDLTGVAVMAVNMGRNATDIAKKWLLTGQDADYKYLDGFIREMIFAMAEYTAAAIVKEGCCVGSLYSLGTAKEGSAKIQSALIRELDAQQIDISFSRNYLMAPEYSALALVLPK